MKPNTVDPKVTPAKQLTVKIYTGEKTIDEIAIRLKEWIEGKGAGPAWEAYECLMVLKSQNDILVELREKVLTERFPVETSEEAMGIEEMRSWVIAEIDDKLSPKPSKKEG